MNIVILESLGTDPAYIQPYIEKLERLGHTVVQYENCQDKDVQKERLKDADIVLLANSPIADDAIHSSIQYIDVAFTGIDHLPDSVWKLDIPVSNASGYADQAVAELAVSQMIQLLRHVPETESALRQGKTKAGHLGNLLCGKTAGIVGAGAIGLKTAALLKAFGCTVIAHSRHEKESSYVDKWTDLNTLLKEADIVSLHTPLTGQTYHMIDEKAFSLMKPSSYLINMARGPVVDSDALYSALISGQIAGAAIDVFDKEPPLEFEILLDAPHLLATPHIGFWSQESMEQRADIVFENLFEFLAGNHIRSIKKEPAGS
jgi:D-3-phosphoglycerate dehydrogenase